MVVMLSKVMINDVDVTNYTKSWKIVKQYSSTVAGLDLNLITTVDNVISLENNMKVEVWRGTTTSTDYKVYYGFIDSYKRNISIYELKCSDKMQLAKRAEITYSYDKDIDDSAGVGSEIYKDMIDNYTSLEYSATSIVSTGTTLLLSKFIGNHADVFERGEKICEIYDYQHYYNPVTDKVHFEPKGYINSSVVLSVGTNVNNQPKWEYDFSEAMNYITVIGAEQEVETTQIFTAIAAQTDFTLVKTPTSVKVYCDDVLQTGGTIGSSSVYDYSVDKENKKIVFASAPGDSVEVRVEYSYMVPIPIVGKDQVSIEKYCNDDDTQAFKHTFFKPELKTKDDAENFLRKMLEKYSTPFVSTTVNTDNELSLQAGQTVRVVDINNNEDRYLLVSKITMSYPHKGDEIEVGDKIWRLADWQTDTSNRIRRLEEELGNNQDILIQIVVIDREVEVYRRDTTVQVKSYDPSETDVFILGNSLYGVLGVNKLGDTSGETAVTTQLYPGNMIYREYIFDDKYFASGTTGTVDDTDNTITLGMVDFVDGFEDDDDGWETVSSYVSSPERSTTWKSEGSYSMKLGCHPDSKYYTSKLSAIIKKTLGKCSTITFDYYIPAATSGNIFTVWCNGSLVFSEFVQFQNKQVLNKVVNVTPDGYIEFTGQLIYGQYYVYVDNIRYSLPAIIESEPIYYNTNITVPITQVKATVYFTNTIDFYITGDGGLTWESITLISGVPTTHTLLSYTGDIRYKIESDDSVLSSQKNTAGRFIAPAIKIELIE